MPDNGIHIEMTGELAQVIKHLYCIRTPADAAVLVQHLSPSLEMMLIFNLGSPVRVSFGDQDFGEKQMGRVSVTGPLRKMLNYELLPGADIIAVAFHPNGFYRLFQIPLDEMQDEAVRDPDQMPGINGFKDLWEILSRTPDLEARVELLSAYGLAFIREADAESQPLLTGIMDQTYAGNQPTKAIAIDTDLSTRTIQMRFQKYLGFSTKELTRFLRFKQVIDFIQSQADSVDWLAVVEQFGYHDQSHLIKDFRHYLATTPRKFVQDFLGKEFCVSKPAKGGL